MLYSACKKTAFGNIPCSRQGNPNCGIPCNKVIAGCGHKCNKVCHEDACFVEGDSCKEKCNRVRAFCGHVCGFTCHGTDSCTQDRPCLAKLNLYCSCGIKKSVGICGLWQGNKVQTQMLDCTDECARVKRNQVLANALQINVEHSVFSSSYAKSLYSSTLVAFAHDHIEWVKQIEKVVMEFIRKGELKHKPDVHYFPHYKPQFNLYLGEYVKAFGLTAEIVDEHIGKGNVIMRRSGEVKVPLMLLSGVAEDYRRDEHKMYESFESLLMYHGGAVNAILIRGFELEVELDDLRVLIQPLFGSEVVVAFKWVDNDEEAKARDLLLLVSEMGQSRVAVEDIEKLLVEKREVIYEKFVKENSWATGVSCCWVNKEGEVKDKKNVEKGIGKKEILRKQVDSINTSNPFDVLL